MMVNVEVLVVLLGTIGCVISGKSPIIIVPGWGVSQLEARISDGSLCDTGGEWVRVWINHDNPKECISKALTLQYDDSTSTYDNLPGVEVRVPGFGDTVGVEYPDDNRTIGNFKFNVFIDHFVNGNGYVRGKTIRAAPYDWRLASDSLAKIGYYDSLKALVEEMYEDANNEKVSIVVHSMGGPVTLYFFNNIVTQDWKDKYINVFIPLSAGWAGVPLFLMNYISPNLPNVLGLIDESFTTLQSAVWSLPNPLIWKDKVVLTIDNTSYTGNNYMELLTSILHREIEYKKIQQVQSLLGDYPPPNVPTHCLYGVGVPTIEAINYGRGFPHELKSVTSGDGDGVVNTFISEVCQMWSSQKEVFQVRKFVNVNHIDIALGTEVMDAIHEVIMNPNIDSNGFCDSDTCKQ